MHRHTLASLSYRGSISSFLCWCPHNGLLKLVRPSVHSEHADSEAEYRTKGFQ